MRRRTLLSRLGVMTIVASASMSCTADDGRPVVGPQVSDSAGIRLVENGDLSASTASLELSEKSLRIGVADGSEDYQFFRVSDLRVVGDSVLVVTNGGTREVKVYGLNGEHRATFGGPGQGPAEFGYPNGIVSGGDTVTIQDRLDLVRFTLGGEFIGRVTTDREELMDILGGPAEGGSWLPDGSYFTPIYERENSPPTPGPPFRPRMTLVRVGGNLASVDTLGVFGGIEQQFVEVGGERGVMPVIPPYSANSTWGVGASDGTVVVGDSKHPQIWLFRGDGSATVARWSDDPDPLTGSEVAEWKDAYRAQVSGADRMTMLERGWEQMDVPETKARFSRVAGGSDGTGWVFDWSPNSPSTTLRAFAPDGIYLGALEVPGSFRPMDSGDGWVAGVTTGANDVEFVNVYWFDSGVE